MTDVRMTPEEFLPWWLMSWLEAWAAFGEQFSDPMPDQWRLRTLTEARLSEDLR